MERTEERGWYLSHDLWTGRATSHDDLLGLSNDATLAGEEIDPASSTVIADESRSKCAICGLSFNMIFDQDEGEWMYTNCREVPVLKSNNDTDDNNNDDDDDDQELMLLHLTCVKALGFPDQLLRDQVLQF